MQRKYTAEDVKKEFHQVFQTKEIAYVSSSTNQPLLNRVQYDSLELSSPFVTPEQRKHTYKEYLTNLMERNFPSFLKTVIVTRNSSLITGLGHLYTAATIHTLTDRYEHLEGIDYDPMTTSFENKAKLAVSLLKLEGNMNSPKDVQEIINNQSLYSQQLSNLLDFNRAITFLDLVDFIRIGIDYTQAKEYLFTKYRDTHYWPAIENELDEMMFKRFPELRSTGERGVDKLRVACEIFHPIFKGSKGVELTQETEVFLDYFASVKKTQAEDKDNHASKSPMGLFARAVIDREQEQQVAVTHITGEDELRIIQQFNPIPTNNLQQIFELLHQGQTMVHNITSYQPTGMLENTINQEYESLAPRVIYLICKDIKAKTGLSMSQIERYFERNRYSQPIDAMSLTYGTEFLLEYLAQVERLDLHLYPLSKLIRLQPKVSQ